MASNRHDQLHVCVYIYTVDSNKHNRVLFKVTVGPCLPRWNGEWRSLVWPGGSEAPQHGELKPVPPWAWDTDFSWDRGGCSIFSRLSLGWVDTSMDDREKRFKPSTKEGFMLAVQMQEYNNYYYYYYYGQPCQLLNPLNPFTPFLWDCWDAGKAQIYKYTSRTLLPAGWTQSLCGPPSCTESLTCCDTTLTSTSLRRRANHMSPCLSSYQS